MKERAGAGELGAGLCWWANMTSLHYNLRAHQYFQSNGARFSRDVRTVGVYCEAGESIAWWQLVLSENSTRSEREQCT